MIASGWLYLLCGTIGEVVWVLTLKPTDGFTKLGPSTINVVVAFLNIWLLSNAFKLLPTASAYIIWVGLSAVAITTFAYYFQGEQMTLSKLFFIGVILTGIWGLKIVTQQ